MKMVKIRAISEIENREECTFLPFSNDFYAKKRCSPFFPTICYYYNM